MWYPTGYLSTDYSIMFLLRKIGADFGSWSEVCSLWSSPPINVGNKYAVLHPFRLEPHNTGGEGDCTLHIVTTCKGRLHHLKQTLPTWLQQDGVDVTVVDYSCPDRTGDWVHRYYPEVQVVRVKGKETFHLAHARNRGAGAAPKGWLCFFDADLVVKSGWERAVRKALIPGHYHVASPLQWGMTGSCIVHSDDYVRAGLAKILIFIRPSGKLVLVQPSGPDNLPKRSLIQTTSVSLITLRVSKRARGSTKNTTATKWHS